MNYHKKMNNMNYNYDNYQLFAERYQLIQLLGRGGFSEVWLAEDTKTNIHVALKIYAPGGGLDDDGVRLFRQEFAMVFELNHANLLKPTYYDDYNRMPYLVLPYCERGSTDSLIGKMTEDEVWRFFRDVAAGLAYLHSIDPPMIHQDIKPDNVMLANDGSYQITDFGISTRVRSTLRKNVDINNDNQEEPKTTKSSGTLAYMSPERYSRDSRPIPESDIWALGATAFELMTGRTPYNEFGGVLQLNGAEVPIVYGNYSDELKSLVEYCLARDPKDRPTAAEISEYANEVIHGKFRSLEQRRIDLGIIPTPKKRAEHKKKTSIDNKKKSRLWLALLLVVLVVTGGYVAIYYYLSNDMIKNKDKVETIEQNQSNLLEDKSITPIQTEQNEPIVIQEEQPKIDEIHVSKNEEVPLKEIKPTSKPSNINKIKDEDVLVEKPVSVDYSKKMYNLIGRIERCLNEANTPYKVDPLVKAMKLCDSMDYYRRLVDADVYNKNKDVVIKVERQVDDTYEALILEARGFVENATTDGFDDYENAIYDYELAQKLKYSDEVEKEIKRLKKLAY